MYGLPAVSSSVRASCGLPKASRYRPAHTHMDESSTIS